MSMNVLHQKTSRTPPTTKYSIDSSRITTVLTSCGRFDLLDDTISSFLGHFEAGRIIICEDSEKSDEAATFAGKFLEADVRVNMPKLGQLGSIDSIYRTLSTPYVLHLEDDWRFIRGIDLDSVIDFLESRPDISVVCIANRVFNARYAKHSHRVRHGDIDYLVWDLDAHPKWFSYSFNPSIARLSLWHEHGPFTRFVTEENLSLHCKERGMRIAMIVPAIADHIGDHRHAHDPFQPKRATTPLSRIKRSIAKRLDTHQLAYLGRHAWVSLKQTAGLTRRNDRTYYVDRLVRALRSGALPRTYGILATGKNDGAGSQAQGAMSALCFAEAFGLTYVHRPFTLVDHAEGPMHSWVRQCEAHFNLGAGAVTEEARSDPVVPLDELLMAPGKWPATAIIAAPHYLHYCNQDPEAWERVLPLLRARFWENKPPRPRVDFRIALHMRRGDVSAGDKKVARNFTPNAAFLRTLEIIMDAVSHYASGEVRIELFSQGDPAIFQDFVRFGCELRLDEPALTTHRALIEADVLIMSKGAFSYTAGVLGEGVTLYDPQKYRPLQNWIVRAADGSFDRAHFTERLEALLARRNVEALRTRTGPAASRTA